MDLIAAGIRRTSLTRDELLDNVMIYWLTETAASCLRDSTGKVSARFRPTRS